MNGSVGPLGWAGRDAQARDSFGGRSDHPRTFSALGGGAEMFPRPHKPVVEKK